MLFSSNHHHSSIPTKQSICVWNTRQRGSLLPPRPNTTTPINNQQQHTCARYASLHSAPFRSQKHPWLSRFAMSRDVVCPLDLVRGAMRQESPLLRGADDITSYHATRKKHGGLHFPAQQKINTASSSLAFLVPRVRGSQLGVPNSNQRDLTDGTESTPGGVRGGGGYSSHAWP